MRILLGDQLGRVRAEVRDGNVGNLVWRLNSAGSATLTIARSSSAFRRELLEPGARIYVELDNGLPAWGGVLDLPRTWQPGELKIQAYTIERLLDFSITPKTRAFYGELTSNVFTQILQEADQRAALGITVGSVWNGGAAHYPRYHFRRVTWALNDSLRKMETCDYRFTPYLDDGAIRFHATLEERMGDDLSGNFALIESVNATSTTLTEQGNIVNRVAVVGSGATWGEREVVWGAEEESRRRYGLREAALVPQDVGQTVTLARYAETAIRENAYPHTLATLGVVDSEPARFADYDVGDVMRVVLPSYGFDGYDAPMRVIARGFDPRTGECEVVCDERFEYIPTLQAEDETAPTEGDVE